MPDSSQNARLKELTDRIENERDPEKYRELAKELNALLEEQKKPVKPSE